MLCIICGRACSLVVGIAVFHRGLHAALCCTWRGGQKHGATQTRTQHPKAMDTSDRTEQCDCTRCNTLHTRAGIKERKHLPCMPESIGAAACAGGLREPVHAHMIHSTQEDHAPHQRQAHGSHHNGYRSTASRALSGALLIKHAYVSGEWGCVGGVG